MNNTVKMGLCLAGLVGGVVLVVKGIQMYRAKKLNVVEEESEQEAVEKDLQKCLTEATKLADQLGPKRDQFIQNYNDLMNEIKVVKNDLRRADMVENLLGSIVLKNGQRFDTGPFMTSQINNWVSLAKTKLVVHFQNQNSTDATIAKVAWVMDSILEYEPHLLKKAS